MQSAEGKEAYDTNKQACLEDRGDHALRGGRVISLRLWLFLWDR